MLYGFEKIIEERILTAQKRGEFENLPGAGKPLEFEDDRFVSEELRLAYKILKNADCVPVEIELKKEIKQTEDLLAGMQETSEKYRILKKLNFLILKLNSIRDTSIVHEMPQVYTGKLVERFENSKTI
jgi:DnaJ homologue, subfamily C, member 28, conserved domain